MKLHCIGQLQTTYVLQRKRSRDIFSVIFKGQNLFFLPWKLNNISAKSARSKNEIFGLQMARMDRDCNLKHLANFF